MLQLLGFMWSRHLCLTLLEMLVALHLCPLELQAQFSADALSPQLAQGDTFVSAKGREGFSEEIVSHLIFFWKSNVGLYSAFLEDVAKDKLH